MPAPDGRLPFEETPGERLVRTMREAGFAPTGERDVFALEFVGELPALPGERLIARIRFEKGSDGVASPWPTGLVISHHRHLPVSIEALGSIPEAAQSPLLAALEPYLARPAPPKPSAHVAAAVCATCGMKSPEWVVIGSVRLCLICELTTDRGPG